MHEASELGQKGRAAAGGDPGIREGRTYSGEQDEGRDGSRKGAREKCEGQGG